MPVGEQRPSARVEQTRRIGAFPEPVEAVKGNAL